MLSAADSLPDLYSRVLHVPTLLWLGYPDYDDLDSVLDGLSLVGMIISVVVMVLGSANMLLMTLLWMLYFSLVSVGRVWFSFGWESQLLETGFLAVWCVPLISLHQFSLPSPWLCVLGYRWLIFRIMIGAGNNEDDIIIN